MVEIKSFDFVRINNDAHYEFMKVVSDRFAAAKVQPRWRRKNNLFQNKWRHPRDTQRITCFKINDVIHGDAQIITIHTLFGLYDKSVLKILVTY